MRLSSVCEKSRPQISGRAVRRLTACGHTDGERGECGVWGAAREMGMMAQSGDSSLPKWPSEAVFRDMTRSGIKLGSKSMKVFFFFSGHVDVTLSSSVVVQSRHRN